VTPAELRIPAHLLRVAVAGNLQRAAAAAAVRAGVASLIWFADGNSYSSPKTIAERAIIIVPRSPKFGLLLKMITARLLRDNVQKIR
jgi:hypothetical protein